MRQDGRAGKCSEFCAVRRWLFFWLSSPEPAYLTRECRTRSWCHTGVFPQFLSTATVLANRLDNGFLVNLIARTDHPVFVERAISLGTPSRAKRSAEFTIWSIRSSSQLFSSLSVFLLLIVRATCITLWTNPVDSRSPEQVCLNSGWPHRGAVMALTRASEMFSSADISKARSLLFPKPESAACSRKISAADW